MPGGYFYAEDFFLKNEPPYKYKEILSKSFHANYLVNFNMYLSDLKKNDFKILYVEDISNKWISFTKNRLKNFKNNIENTITILDKETVINLLNFYELAYKLLSDKILGGIKYVCIK